MSLVLEFVIFSPIKIRKILLKSSRHEHQSYSAYTLLSTLRSKRSWRDVFLWMEHNVFWVIVQSHLSYRSRCNNNRCHTSLCVMLLDGISLLLLLLFMYDFGDCTRRLSDYQSANPLSHIVHPLACQISAPEDGQVTFYWWTHMLIL